MSSALQIFNFEGHEIRFVGTPEKPEWIAQDICDFLGIAEAKSSMRGFSSSQKGVHTMHTPGGIQEFLTAFEPGVYRLIFKSRKPDAERFQNWVTDVVLPGLRRDGTFSLATAEVPLEPEIPVLSGDNAADMVAICLKLLSSVKGHCHELSLNPEYNSYVQSIRDVAKKSIIDPPSISQQYIQENRLLPAAVCARVHGFPCSDPNTLGTELTAAFRGAYGIEPQKELFDYGGTIGERWRNVYPCADPVIVTALNRYFLGSRLAAA